MNKINRMISNYNYNPGNISRIKYIVIHYVGALGGAQENCAYYGGGNRGASAHYFVGFAGEIWQCVEDRNIAWHCGASSYKHPECRNANSIGIEMCVRKKNAASLGATDKDWYFEGATVQSAIELTKYLMQKYNIPADHVIRHYDVTGKICPNPYVYNTGTYTWDAFKKAKQCADQHAGCHVYNDAGKKVYTSAKLPYKVRPKTANVPIRTGPAKTYSAARTFLQSGKYEIVEEKNGFGKLKSGVGWVYLKKVERV